MILGSASLLSWQSLTSITALGAVALSADMVGTYRWLSTPARWLNSSGSLAQNLRAHGSWPPVYAAKRKRKAARARRSSRAAPKSRRLKRKEYSSRQDWRYFLGKP